MMQAMIFAAGLGTRLKPITDHMPKAMVRVGGEPLIRRVVEKIKDAGAERVVVNVHHFASQITDYLKENNNFGIDIRVSDETEKLLDTGGGIKKAAPLFRHDIPILIHNVDILSNVDLKKFYSEACSEETADNVEGRAETDALLLVSERKTKRYLLFNDSMRLVGWTNIETGEVRSPYPDLDPKQCRMYAFAGIHAISPRLFKVMNDDFQDKFGIIDLYLHACRDYNIRGYLKRDLHLLDVGKLDTLKEAEEFVEIVE